MIDQEPQEQQPAPRGYPYNTTAWWRLTLTSEQVDIKFTYTVGVELRMNVRAAYDESDLPQEAKQLAYTKVYEQLATWQANKHAETLLIFHAWEYVGGDEYIHSEEAQGERHSRPIE